MSGNSQEKEEADRRKKLGEKPKTPVSFLLSPFFSVQVIATPQRTPDLIHCTNLGSRTDRLKNDGTRRREA
jgi:hypothetical protein